MDKSNKIENLANKYVERHIRDRHLSDDTIKEIKIAYIMIRYIITEDYYKNKLDPNEAIYVDGPVAHYNVEDNYYSLAKHKNIQIKIRNIIEPDGEFENLVERLFNEAKKNLL